MQTENQYDEAVRILTSREKFHICLGLDRISSILKILGNPQNKLKIIHIAGTNGKGSVSKIISEVLICAGYKTGLYTSPHILDYTERIQINNTPVPKDDFARLIKDICSLSAKKNIYLTEFEVLTAVMFKYFADNNTEICVVETGLGGRLDATNAAEHNLLSVITSISLDHTDRLGNTIEKIAAEKAGIIKQECPVVVNPENRGYKVIEITAKKLNSKIIKAQHAELQFSGNDSYAIIDGNKYIFNMLGLWQKDNLGLAAAAVSYLQEYGLNITEEAFSSALKNVVWPCRFQYIKEKNLIIDGTHNPDGARLLRSSLDFYFPTQKRTWIYGSMKNKDYKKIMKILFRDEDNVYFCEFNHSGSAGADDLYAAVQKNYKKIDIKNIEKFLTYAETDRIYIISGSFYLIGEILNLNQSLKNISRLDNS